MPATSSIADRHLWEIEFARDLGWLILGLVVCAAFVAAGGVLLPVIAALLLAYIVDPLLEAMARRWHWPRWLTALLLALVTGAVVLTAIVWLVPIVTDQLRTLAQRVPEYVRTLSSRLGVDPSGFDGWLEQTLATVRADPRRALASVFRTTGTALEVARRVLGAAGHTALVAFVTPILFVGFAWHFRAMIGWIHRLVPESRRAEVVRLARRMDRVVAGFFRGRVVISFFVGILLALGWKVTGVPYWAVLGFAAGVLNVVPYLSTVAWPTAIALRYAESLTSGDPLSPMAIVVFPSLVFFAVQLVENWILTPWIQGDSTDLGVVTITVVMLVAGATGGVVGLFLAIPLAACAKILLYELFLPRAQRWAAKH